MPDKRISSQYEDSDLYSTPNLICTTSLRAGTSQKPALTPDSEGGLLKTSSSSSFCALLSFAAFSLPACPVTPDRSLFFRHCDSHLRTVPSARSTISAIISRPTPRAAHTIASAFICTNL